MFGVSCISDSFGRVRESVLMDNGTMSPVAKAGFPLMSGSVIFTAVVVSVERICRESCVRGCWGCVE